MKSIRVSNQEHCGIACLVDDCCLCGHSLQIRPSLYFIRNQIDHMCSFQEDCDIGHHRPARTMWAVPKTRCGQHVVRCLSNLVPKASRSGESRMSSDLDSI